MYDSYHDESLEHFGIKGMKWGIRRTPEQLGHRKQRTPEQIARAAKRKETLKKAAKTAAKVGLRIGLTYAGGVAISSIVNSPSGKAAISAGTNVITNLLNIKDGPTYSSIKTIDEQKLEQWLRGSVRADGNTITYTNLKSKTAQKLEQDIRRSAKAQGY